MSLVEKIQEAIPNALNNHGMLMMLALLLRLNIMLNVSQVYQQ